MRRASGRRGIERALRWPAALVGAAIFGYAAVAGAAWFRYGRSGRPPDPDDADPLLDRFFPVCDVVERHRIAVDAPPEITLAAARDVRFDDSSIVRLIFRVRELAMGGEPSDRATATLEAQMRSIGWGVLDEIPGRAIVFGAVTAPWEANPVFRPLPPDAFAAFDEPGLVRIAWTLRADAAGEGRSIFRTETRAHPTDPGTRARFRRYWALVSPGVWTIRRLLLRPVRREAERRWRMLQRSGDVVH